MTSKSDALVVVMTSGPIHSAAFGSSIPVVFDDPGTPNTVALMLGCAATIFLVAMPRPGQKTVSFSLSSADLAIYNDHMQLVAEPGTFRIWIAPDSTRGVGGEFVLR